MDLLQKKKKNNKKKTKKKTTKNHYVKWHVKYVDIIPKRNWYEMYFVFTVS